MSSMKITGKLSRILPAITITRPSAAWRSRIFATKATTPLQSKKGGEKKTLEKTTDAASAVKDGAKEVRVTTEKLTDIASNTKDSMSKVSKDVTGKVVEQKNNVTGKIVEKKDNVTGKVAEEKNSMTEKVTETKNKVSGVVGTAKNATQFVKGKVNK